MKLECCVGWALDSAVTILQWKTPIHINTHTDTHKHTFSQTTTKTLNCARSRFAKQKQKQKKNANAASYKHKNIYIITKHPHTYNIHKITLKTTSPQQIVHIYIVRKAPHRVRQHTQKQGRDDEIYKNKENTKKKSLYCGRHQGKPNQKRKHYTNSFQINMILYIYIYSDKLLHKPLFILKVIWRHLKKMFSNWKD